MADWGALADGILRGYSTFEAINNANKRTKLAEKRDTREEDDYQTRKKERQEQIELQKKQDKLKAIAYSLETGADLDPIVAINEAFADEIQSGNKKPTKVIGAIPDPNQKGNVLLELDVGGEKKPLTENRSSDPNDSVKSIPMKDIYGELYKKLGVYEIMADPRYGKDEKFMAEAKNKVNALRAQYGDYSVLEDARRAKERAQDIELEDTRYKRNRADQLADLKSSRAHAYGLADRNDNRAIAREERAFKRQKELYGIEQDREAKAALAKGTEKAYQTAYEKALEFQNPAEAALIAQKAANDYVSTFDPNAPKPAGAPTPQEVDADIAGLKSGQINPQEFDAKYGAGKSQRFVSGEPVPVVTPQSRGLTPTQAQAQVDTVSGAVPGTVPTPQTRVEIPHRTPFDNLGEAYNEVASTFRETPEDIKASLVEEINSLQQRLRKEKDPNTQKVIINDIQSLGQKISQLEGANAN